MIKLQNHCVIPFGFKKENRTIFVTSLELYLFFFFNYLLLGTEKTLSTFIVDLGWREIRLPSLARVLLCLVRLGVQRVSWVVSYLDMPCSMESCTLDVISNIASPRAGIKERL